MDAERPLILELDGARVALAGFVATCPARIEPCNGVQQNSKVRTTTDKSWPKLEVLPDGSDELAVNLREAKSRIYAEGSQGKIRTSLNRWMHFTATKARVCFIRPRVGDDPEAFMTERYGLLKEAECPK